MIFVVIKIRIGIKVQVDLHPNQVTVTHIAIHTKQEVHHGRTRLTINLIGTQVQVEAEAQTDLKLIKAMEIDIIQGIIIRVGDITIEVKVQAEVEVLLNFHVFSVIF
ncbi:unnamed protein product [Meloidogyne enterolobii]|uniref:Uncharacterized protein n=1 Tax=Meloidogyne enterolobii TaxID=390850 RepID=A0ACB1AEM2_MELEN